MAQRGDEDNGSDVVQYGAFNEQADYLPYWQNPDNSSFWKDVNPISLGQDWNVPEDAQQKEDQQQQNQMDQAQEFNPLDQMAQTAGDAALTAGNLFSNGWNTFWGMMGQAQTEYDANQKRTPLNNPYPGQTYQQQQSLTPEWNRIANPPMNGQDWSSFYDANQSASAMPTETNRGAVPGMSANDYNAIAYRDYYAAQQRKAQQQAATFTGDYNTPEYTAAAYDYNAPRPGAYQQYQGATPGMSPAEYDRMMTAANQARYATPYNPNMPDYKGPVYGTDPRRFAAMWAAAQPKKAATTKAGYKPSNYSGYGGGGYSPYPRYGSSSYRPYSPYSPREASVPEWYLAMMNWRR